MNNIQYRQLKIDDILAYKTIRLEMLKEEDASFGSSYDEESLFDQRMWINRLSKTINISYGAYEGDLLVGIVMAVLNPRKKMKHVATLNSLYVTKDNRKAGIARRLVEGLIDILKSKEVESIKLSVVTGNIHAISLYRSLGFSIYGREDGFIKIGEDYIDQFLLRLDLFQ